MLLLLSQPFVTTLFVVAVRYLLYELGNCLSGVTTSLPDAKAPGP